MITNVFFFSLWPILSGKTTFLNHFEKFSDVLLLTEPVEQWRNLK
jgi:hypothetical protein